jgi:hypothetical protein
MSERAKVWVVEHGEYSDYRVVGVFSSEEKAQLIANAISGSIVNEWTMDPAVDELRQGFHPFIVDMRQDGTVERCDKWEITPYEIAGCVRIWHRTQAPAYRDNPDKPDVLHAEVWAKDAEHAIKITNEHRTRMIATGEWKMS